MIEQWVWSILLYGGSFFAILYASFLSWYRRVWDAMPTFDVPDHYQPKTNLTVLVPARNESRVIQRCLQALRNQDYPDHLLEVIVIDDGSEDNTAQLVEQFWWDNLRLIQREGGGKKAALQHGVSAAAGELIVTTDADCEASSSWLRHLAAAYEQFDAAFIAAPVQFTGSRNLLQRFQALDLLGMMLLTGAGIAGRMHFLGNGANMAYPRKLFLDLDGYRHNQHRASGDDVYLIHQIAQRYPQQIIFVKQQDATVSTESPADFPSFWRQRLRWATKNGHSKDLDLLLSLSQVFLLCWFIILTVGSIPFYGLKAFMLAIVLFGAKAFQDYHLLRKASTYFQREDLMRHFWQAQILHILYIAGIGLVANLRKSYTWKGRTVR